MTNNNIIPRGWYFCAESTEIKPGQVLGKELFGVKVVLWRGKSGKLTMSHSVCPHLGSDLGKLGRVHGDNLRCFSHDYTYNHVGDCIATGSKELPLCNKKVLRNYPLHEKNGFVIVWYDAAGKEPSWSIPDDIFAIDSSKFTRSHFEFNVTLETLNKDNFDVGHLYKWHNVYDVKTTPVECSGPMISISHAFKRHSIIFKKPLKPPLHFLSAEVNSKYSSTLYGHGLTNSFIDIYNYNIHLHDLIWCTPISATRTLYTTFVRQHRTQDQDNILKKCFKALMFRACVWRLRQEHKHEGYGFWENQSPVAVPLLTETERQIIGPYREWCAQFLTVASDK